MSQNLLKFLEDTRCNFSAGKAEELIAAAKESFYWQRASRSRGISVSMQIEEISSLSSKMEEIEEEIKSILDPADPQGGPSSFSILNSIKGVGIGTISAFLGAVGDMSRFLNSDKLVSYIGFYPRIFELRKIQEEKSLRFRKQVQGS